MTQWSASGCLPGDQADALSEEARAVMSVIGYFCWQSGSCHLTTSEIGRAAGVTDRSVRGALRLGRHGLISINNAVIQIADERWIAWLASGAWYGPADFRIKRDMS